MPVPLRRVIDRLRVHRFEPAAATLAMAAD
jgi:hypothetical protein